MDKKQIIEQLESLRENSKSFITKDSDPIWEEDVKVLDSAISILNELQTEEENKETYIKAIERYGLNAQIDMVFEEMSELQKELCKFKRGKDTVDNIAEEIADVTIMLEQMQLAFDIKDKVDIKKHLKVKRLENRLKSMEEEKDNSDLKIELGYLVCKCKEGTCDDCCEGCIKWNEEDK